MATRRPMNGLREPSDTLRRRSSWTSSATSRPNGLNPNRRMPGSTRSTQVKMISYDVDVADARHPQRPSGHAVVGIVGEPESQVAPTSRRASPDVRGSCPGKVVDDIGPHVVRGEQDRFDEVLQWSSSRRSTARQESFSRRSWPALPTTPMPGHPPPFANRIPALPRPLATRARAGSRRRAAVHSEIKSWWLGVRSHSRRRRPPRRHQPGRRPRRSRRRRRWRGRPAHRGRSWLGDDPLAEQSFGALLRSIDPCRRRRYPV